MNKALKTIRILTLLTLALTFNVYAKMIITKIKGPKVTIAKINNKKLHIGQIIRFKNKKQTKAYGKITSLSKKRATVKLFKGYVRKGYTPHKKKTQRERGDKKQFKDRNIELSYDYTLGYFNKEFSDIKFRSDNLKLAYLFHASNIFTISLGLIGTYTIFPNKDDSYLTGLSLHKRLAFNLSSLRLFTDLEVGEGAVKNKMSPAIKGYRNIFLSLGIQYYLKAGLSVQAKATKGGYEFFSSSIKNISVAFKTNSYSLGIGYIF